MKKKYVVAVITCTFLLVSGICYSCAYDDSEASTLHVTKVQEDAENSEQQSKRDQKSEELKLDKIDLQSQGSKEEKSNINANQTSNDDINSGSVEAVIYVHICGAVVNPGVYLTDSQARLCDLIQLSGGLKKEAAGDYINQAQQVIDGQRIYIPTIDEVAELSAQELITGDESSIEGTSDTSKLVNINTASAEELMELPGIGQAKSDSIIAYRASKGNFQSIEDLMSIPGIKEGLFNQISSYICVK